MAGRTSTYRERNSTADNALDILLLFSEGRTTISAADVAARLGVARSTGYRYLQSLRMRSLVVEDGGRYRLGPTIFELARIARVGLGLVEIAHATMVDLAENMHHTVLLTRRSGGSVVCMDAVESSRPFRISYQVGQGSPLNAGAAAEAILAWEDPRTVRELLASHRLPRFTARTITEPAAMLRRIERIRAHGVAIAKGEFDPDIVGVGAPVFGADGEVCAAVSIAAVASRYQPRRARECEQAVLDAARSISSQLELMQLGCPEL